MKQRKSWRMSCDLGKPTEGLDNELCSFSTLSVTSSTLQLILQPSHHFTCVKTHSPILPLLHLRHSSFSNPSFASPTSQALRLRHLARRPCISPTLITKYLQNIVAEHFPTLLLLILRHRLFTYVIWRAAHAYLLR